MEVRLSIPPQYTPNTSPTERARLEAKTNAPCRTATGQQDVPTGETQQELQSKEDSLKDKSLEIDSQRNINLGTEIDDRGEENTAI
ncbi:hypothetical protein ACROYT_G031150 [Oculina patagonica]